METSLPFSITGVGRILDWTRSHQISGGPNLKPEAKRQLSTMQTQFIHWYLDSDHKDTKGQTPEYDDVTQFVLDAVRAGDANIGENLNKAAAKVLGIGPAKPDVKNDGNVETSRTVEMSASTVQKTLKVWQSQEVSSNHLIQIFEKMPASTGLMLRYMRPLFPKVGTKSQSNVKPGTAEKLEAFIAFDNNGEFSHSGMFH